LLAHPAKKITAAKNRNFALIFPNQDRYKFKCPLVQVARER